MMSFQGVRILFLSHEESVFSHFFIRQYFAFYLFFAIKQSWPKCFIDTVYAITEENDYPRKGLIDQELPLFYDLVLPHQEFEHPKDTYDVRLSLSLVATYLFRNRNFSCPSADHYAET